MRIAICDDSAIDRGLIIELLTHYFTEKFIDIESIEYDNGTNLLCDIEEGLWYDIIFLDIYMDILLGIEVAYRLRANGYSSEIIFTTASADFAVDSYDVDAAGYLLKPHCYEKVSQVLNRIMQKFDLSVYPVQQRAATIRIPLHEILYVESKNSKCILHRCNGSTYNIYKRLDDIEAELNSSHFLRCHQSYLVNMDHIQQADKQFVLTSGDIIHIRQRELKAIRQAYLDYAAAKARKSQLTLPAANNCKKY